MKKVFPYLLFSILLVFNCSNNDPDSDPNMGESPEAETCALIREQVSGSDMRFTNNSDGLPVKVDYQISTYSGSIDIEYDSEKRISKFSFGESEILFSYQGNTIRVNNNFSIDVRSNGFSTGSGEYIYHLTDQGNFSHVEHEGSTIIRYETNSDGNINRVYAVYESTEELEFELLNFDDKINFRKTFPFLISIISGSDLIFTFLPSYLNPNNSLRFITYFSGQANEITRSYTYNEQGYPISSTQPNNLIMSYECQ